jgi:hypothetical protein
MVALAMVALGLLPASPALAAPPANDRPTGALAIPDGPYPALSPLVSDISDADLTNDPSAPSCQSDISRSVWFKFSPSQTGFYRLSTGTDQGTATTVTDTVLGVYTSGGGAAGPFDQVPTTATTIGCDDEGAKTAESQSTLTTKLAAGTTYYVLVWAGSSSDPPDPGETAVQVAALKIAPPANDTAAGVADLPLNRTLTGTLEGGEDDYRLTSGSPCFTGGGNLANVAPGQDVVYRFLAPADGTYGFHADSFVDETQTDVVLYLANAPPGGAAPARVACSSAFNRDGAGEYADGIALAAGQVVYLFVDGGSAVPGASFQITATRDVAETEPNNTPATAQAPQCGIVGTVPGGDADFYSLGNTGQQARVFGMADSSSAGPSSNTDLRVNTATDTLEYDDADLDSQFGQAAPVVAGTVAPGGASYLQVDLIGNSMVLVEPYRLFSVVQPAAAAATAESEPNDSVTHAGSSAINYFSGALSAPLTDSDVYRFDADAGTVIFAGLDGDPSRNNTPLDAQLELLDANGTALSTVNDFHAVSSTTPSPATLTGVTPLSPAEGIAYHAPQTGTYYLRVSSGTESAVGAGDYLLSVSLGCTRGVTPEINDTTLPQGAVGAAYRHAFSASNVAGAAHWSVVGGTLPAGLALAGDGVLTGRPSAIGDSSFDLRVTDDRGLTWTREFALHVGPADTKPPVVSGFRVTNSAFAPAAAKRAVKRGTRFKFKLSEAATVKITIAQRAKGKRKGKRCVKPTHKLRKKRNCIRYLTRGTVRFTGKAGGNSVPFSGRLGRKALKRGRYRATLVATDAAGNKSKPKAVAFRIVRP